MGCGSDLPGSMVMVTVALRSFISGGLKSEAGVLIRLEVLISSWYLDPLKTPDIGMLFFWVKIIISKMISGMGFETGKLKI